MATTTQIAGGGGVRRWSEMQHDLLVAIMSRLGVADLLAGGARLACASWRAAARDPLAWRRLDLRDWLAVSRSRAAAGGGRRDVHGELAGVLEVAAERARGRVEAVLLPDFADEEHLLLLAERSPNLLYFSLSATCITYDQFCQAIGKFRSLKGMAVDESLINYEVLLHVHQCCPDFDELKVFAVHVDEEMASIICNSLPRLKKLEITNSDLSRSAIMTFLDRLEDLEHLDISGYETSAITDVVLKKASRLKAFLWNARHELGEFMDCSNHREHFNLQDPCKCMMDERMMKWLAGPS